MRLVTVKQAAAELFISVPLITHWKLTGRISSYAYPLTELSAKVRKRTTSVRRYLVDLDELEKLASSVADLKLLNSDKRLLRPKEIAEILDVRVERVYGWVPRYSLTKYLPNPQAQKNYLLDGDEVADALVDAGFGYLIK